MEVAIRSLFEAPTVEALAQAAARGARRRGLRWCAMARPAEIPLSFAQRRLWFLDRLEGPSATYNIPMAVRLTGALDRAALEAALGDVVERHESLRTIFPDTLGVPRQLILEAFGGAAAAGGAAVDAGSRCGPGRQRRGAASILPRASAAGAFVCAWRARACAAAAAAPHCGRRLVAGAAVARSCVAYAARLAGQAPSFPALPVQYADYTLWQHQVLGAESDPDSAMARQLAYWTETLKDLPDQIELPTRPATAGGFELSRRHHVPLHIDAELHRACWRWRATARRACSWCCRRGLRRC